MTTLCGLKIAWKQFFTSKQFWIKSKNHKWEISGNKSQGRGKKKIRVCILDCRYVISDRPWHTTSEGPPWFWLLQQAQPGQQQRLRAVLAALSQRCAGRCLWCEEKTCLSDRQPFKSLTGFWGRFHPLSIIQSPTNLGTHRNKVPPLIGGKKRLSISAVLLLSLSTFAINTLSLPSL